MGAHLQTNNGFWLHRNGTTTIGLCRIDLDVFSLKRVSLRKSMCAVSDKKTRNDEKLTFELQQRTPGQWSDESYTM